MSDLAEIWFVAAASGTTVGLLGLLAGWFLRHRSLHWQLAIVGVVTTLTILLGVQAISRRMLISDHDRSVVLIVTSAAAVVSLAVALVLSTALVRWSRSLREDVRRVGDGDAVVGGRRGPVELQALSTELASAHRRLAEARDREQRLEASRRELVSWVSHDLRTPLAGIRVMAEALEDSITTDPARYHRQIRGEVDRMVQMVDDLFELSRIHAGQLVVEPQAIVVGDLVSEALAAADPVARARHVRLGGEVPHGLQVAADPAGLTRVLANLIVNGIRHTPADGSVHVAARSVAGGVELAVTDGCGGIPEDARERLFDLGYRGTSARTPDDPLQDVHTSRAGLGLAIVKGIVEAHHGEVAVDNVGPETSPGAGCRFRVVLPVG
ncbi:histidine kinase [Nocardioides sp. Root122]|uniref:sensor histidine kinase n=1 Tax=Nocardioides TaxID=1839 RepID=UPI0007038127|nr:MULTISPECIES: HAMP domain-containing sensor histidine kinase [Nocardioides]KQV63350.1 histidine kinase [Nocardioides sp. Root122]MCK9825551.1 HAMP domain-containing histidine kinase [Nocardioides cavernae]